MLHSKNIHHQPIQTSYRINKLSVKRGGGSLRFTESDNLQNFNKSPAESYSLNLLNHYCFLKFTTFIEFVTVSCRVHQYMSNPEDSIKLTYVIKFLKELILSKLQNCFTHSVHQIYTTDLSVILIALVKFTKFVSINNIFQFISDTCVNGARPD